MQSYITGEITVTAAQLERAKAKLRKEMRAIRRHPERQPFGLYDMFAYVFDNWTMADLDIHMVEDNACYEDAGRLINPMIAEGQIHGGVAQGIANALLEEIVHDDTGNVLTATFADYLLPTAHEMPAIEIHHLETLTEASMTKAKGLGEGGAIGAPAAVLNAINDALAQFGVSIDEFPATPQRIRAALRAADTAGR